MQHRFPNQSNMMPPIDHIQQQQSQPSQPKARTEPRKKHIAEIYDEDGNLVDLTNYAKKKDTSSNEVKFGFFLS